MGIFEFGKKKNKQNQFDIAVEAYEAGDYSHALELFRTLTRNYNPEAEYYCGLICEKQTPKDLKSAVYWYWISSKHEYEDAMSEFQRTLQELEGEDPFSAGEIYYKMEDYSHAFKLFLNAAHTDHVYAQFQCGLMYKLGRGTNKDLEKSFYWYEKSANLGYIHAQYACAQMYENGEGTQKDLSKAYYWYVEVAKHGDANALYKCGQMCEKGIGVDKSIGKALYWYKKAYHEGNDEADLAYTLILGEDEDYFEAGAIAYQLEEFECALELFEESAECGNAEAQYICGVMYLKGEGTSVDENKGLYWLEQADAQGNESAKELLSQILIP